MTVTMTTNMKNKIQIRSFSSSVIVHGKKKKKKWRKNSQTYLSVNSVNGSDIEIKNTISLTYFLRLVKTSVKTKVLLSKKKITELIIYSTS